MKKITRRSFLQVAGAATAASAMAACSSASSATASTPASSAAASSEAKSEPKAEQIVLRLAETCADNYPATIGCYEFARLVEERTEGRIKIEVMTGGQLGGDEQAVIEQVQFGAIDFTRVNLSPMAEFSPVLNLFQLPFLFSGSDHMHKVIDSDLGQSMLTSVEESGFIGLALYEAGNRNFYNAVRPITKMEDMKGLKIRVPQSQLMLDMVDALGAEAMALAFGEVYSALQTGVIEGAENNWPSYDQTSHYEVAKYITLDAHTLAPEPLICSKIVFDKLSAEDQAIIIEAGKESVVYEREEFLKIQQASIDKLTEAGVEISELDDRTPFETACEPLYTTYASEFTAELDEIKGMK